MQAHFKILSGMDLQIAAPPEQECILLAFKTGCLPSPTKSDEVCSLNAQYKQLKQAAKHIEDTKFGINRHPNRTTPLQQPCTDVARALLRCCGLSFIDQLTERDSLFGLRTGKGWVNMLRIFTLHRTIVGQYPPDWQFMMAFFLLFFPAGWVGRFSPEYPLSRHCSISFCICSLFCSLAILIF